MAYDFPRETVFDDLRSDHENKRFLSQPLNYGWLDRCLDAFHPLRDPVDRVGGRTVMLASGIDDSLSQLLWAFLGNFQKFLIRCVSVSDLEAPRPITPILLPNPARDGVSARPLQASLNLLPEWLRHAIYAAIGEGTGYNPYKYKDHLVHSVLVGILGSFALRNFTVPPEFVAEVYRVEGIHNVPVTPLQLDVLMSHVYAHQGCFGEVTWPLVRQRIDRAWQLTALWHDAGYDMWILAFLAARDFGYLRIAHQLRDTLSGWIKRAARDVKIRLAKTIWPPVHGQLERLQNAAGSEIPGLLKDLDLRSEQVSDCGLGHAFLSSSEFLQVFGDEPDFREAAAAILEHHEHPEPEENPDRPLSERAELFVHNPLGSLLRAMDSIALFSRISLRIRATPPNPASPRPSVIVSLGRFRKSSVSMSWVQSTTRPTIVRVPWTQNARPKFYGWMHIHVRPRR